MAVGEEGSSSAAPVVPEDPDKAKYPIPSWAGKSPAGYHLDVLKNDALVQKIFIDERKSYYFGRNPNQADIIVEHASCSRVHAVLLYHTGLKRFALVDMGSSHGSFYGKIKLEPLKPYFLEPETEFHFGASSRKFIVREKIVTHSGANRDDDELRSTQPSDIQLEQVTEYNTAQNRRAQIIPQSAEEARRKKRPRGNVAFIEEEDVINPEDVDPTIGRFRNLVTTAVISGAGNKRQLSGQGRDGPTRKIVRPIKEDARYAAPMSTTLNITLNSAPDLDLYGNLPKPGTHALGPLAPVHHVLEEDPEASHKKKYAKESWPGRKPQGAY
ncbi:unnamed protein product, partial [Mesorhabditis spiculigera]